MLCKTAAGISVLSAAVVVGKGGGQGTRSLEWLVAAGSGPVISKTTDAAAAADESVES